LGDTPPLNCVLKFLASLYSNGLGYSGVNTARSALPLVLKPIEGFSIGQHSLVIRAVKGVGKLNPPRPRYDSVWYVSCVLNLFDRWECNELLTLKNLSCKLAALLALVTAQLVQTLQAISLPHIKGSNFRQSDNLFLSLHPPHKCVSSQTISRWLKFVLSEANVDASIFKSHSFRHASTSIAFKLGVNVDLIFSRAGWTPNSSTFARYYNKPLDKRPVFGDVVLS